MTRDGVCDPGRTVRIHASDERDIAAGRRDFKAVLHDRLAAGSGEQARPTAVVTALLRARQARGRCVRSQSRPSRPPGRRGRTGRCGPRPDCRAHGSGSGAADRVSADGYRQVAKTHRMSGERDRGAAGVDRRAAIADRQAAAADRELASLDGLTSVHLRRAGFSELEREMATARRTGQPLTVAFFDVNYLQQSMTWTDTQPTTSY